MKSELSRREFAKRLTALGAVGVGVPSVLRAASTQAVAPAATGRPRLPSGVMSGDVRSGRAVLWSRCDRTATMLVEYATSESFDDVHRLRGPVAMEEDAFTAKVELNGLPDDEEIFYRVRFEDILDPNNVSEPVEGRFKTTPADDREVFFAWSGDTCGQGFGIDTSRGGLKSYATMLQMQPDFLVHSGDTIYGDGPIPPEVVLEDGTVWKNLITAEKSKVAETLDEFRGNHFYNTLDEHVRRFNAAVPVYYQWDDHEVLNNWYPTEELLKDDRYTVKSASLLAARSKRAFFECLPVRPDLRGRIFRNIPYGPKLELFMLDMRSYRGVNSPNRQEQPGPDTALLGREQIDELKQALAASKATWKVICSDMPLSLMVKDGSDHYEAVGNGEGPVLGREFEIAEILQFIRDQKIRNTVWITADVHHCASIHYDPARATFKEFDPFWEFISGPLHAGTYPSPEMDPTFGPERRFLGIPEDLTKMGSPLLGYQFFGTVRIDSESNELTVTHWNVAGENLWSKTLAPQKA